jgi:dTDP-L-rhamnose 4-epimerase
MTKRVLITGGAGFIGSHLADELLAKGYHVRCLDNLSPQVHGMDAVRPDYLNPDAELIVGDIRDSESVAQALRGVDIVYHFAAMVGVGQSMYEVADYTSVNNQGTAILYEQLIRKPVEKVVVASSMSLYGEGMYRRGDGQVVPGAERSLDQLKKGDWELFDHDGEPLEPIPTPESKPPVLASIYALSKFDQERMCLILGRTYNIPTVALRFFNVFGTRQALSNPYTGVLAIFAARLLNNKPPMIFEDGLQKRDFVSVKDVARACRLAIETSDADGHTINVGSGRLYTVREVAERIAVEMGKQIEPQINGQYRVGDIRHCFADTTAAKRVLGFEPEFSLENDLAELAEWIEGQVAEDRVGEAHQELLQRGLAV